VKFIELQDYTKYRSQFDWIKVQLPQIIDEIFQDITDVKIQFNTGSEYNETMVVTVTKEPNQTTKVSKFPRFVSDDELGFWP
jgi:hypothetical protein